MKNLSPHLVTLPFAHPEPIGQPLLSFGAFNMQKGYVYFFRHIGTTPVKIGMTTNETVQSRFNSFKTFAPYGAEILGFIETENPFQLENQLHIQFKDKRLSGEFFEISADIVNSLIIKHGNKKINQLKQDFELWLSGINDIDIDLNHFKRLILKDVPKKENKNIEYELLKNNFIDSNELISFSEIYEILIFGYPDINISKRKLGIALKKLGYDGKCYKVNKKVFKAYKLEKLPCI